MPIFAGTYTILWNWIWHLNPKTFIFFSFFPTGNFTTIFAALCCCYIVILCFLLAATIFSFFLSVSRKIKMNFKNYSYFEYSHYKSKYISLCIIQNDKSKVNEEKYEYYNDPKSTATYPKISTSNLFDKKTELFDELKNLCLMSVKKQFLVYNCR